MADADYLYKLKKNRVALVRDLIPDPIADHLLAEDVISQEEYEMVLYCNQTTAGRNRRLLDIVATKGPHGYMEMRHAMVTDFHWLAELLDNTAAPPTVDAVQQTSNVTDKDLETVVQSLLSSGSITSWKFLARKLEISEDKINEIEYHAPRHIKDQIYNMLILWRTENGSKADYSVLCDALAEEGRLATSERIRNNHSNSELKAEKHML